MWMAPDGRAVTIQGLITSDVSVEVPKDAIVRVQVQDVSVADAPAKVIAEDVWERGPSQRDEVRISTFELEARGLEPGRTYSLWVHVDMDGSGKLSPGDMITTQSFPIDTRRASVRIDATVVPI